jgi:hypothetical protein
MGENVTTAVENGEEKLNAALENGKVVLLERIDGEIMALDIFDDKETFIKSYIKKQIDEEYERFVYKTAREAYLLNCNVKFSDYLEEFNHEFWEEGESIVECERTRDKARKMLTYDEVAESINESDYVDGFYEWVDLIQPLVDGENFNYEAKGQNFNDEGEKTSTYIFNLEILFKK